MQKDMDQREIGASGPDAAGVPPATRHMEAGGSADIIATLSEIPSMSYQSLLAALQHSKEGEAHWVVSDAICHEAVSNADRFKGAFRPVRVGRGNRDLMRVGKSAFVTDVGKVLNTSKTQIYRKANRYKVLGDEISRDIATGFLMPLSFYETAMQAKGREREALERIRETREQHPSQTVRGAKRVVDSIRLGEILKQAKQETAMNEKHWKSLDELIYNGRCEEVIQQLIAQGRLTEKTYRFLFVDYSYGQKYRDGRVAAIGAEMCQGDESREAAITGFRAMLPQATRLMMDNAHGLFMTDFGAEPMFRDALEKAGFRIVNVLPWIKGDTVSPLGSPCTWRSNLEYVIHAVRGKPAFYGSGNGVFRDPRDRITLHPFQKPLPLMRTFIEALTQPGDLVIDPCCGSGAFVVAATELGRHAIGIEINAEHALLASNRVKNVQQEMAQKGMQQD